MAEVEKWVFYKRNVENLQVVVFLQINQMGWNFRAHHKKITKQ